MGPYTSLEYGSGPAPKDAQRKVTNILRKAPRRRAFCYLRPAWKTFPKSCFADQSVSSGRKGKMLPDGSRKSSGRNSEFVKIVVFLKNPTKKRSRTEVTDGSKNIPTLNLFSTHPETTFETNPGTLPETHQTNPEHKK